MRTPVKKRPNAGMWNSIKSAAAGVIEKFKTYDEEATNAFAKFQGTNAYLKGKRERAKKGGK